jgi:eukaryotic-like serine/threonine-protein kinase
MTEAKRQTTECPETEDVSGDRVIAPASVVAPAPAQIVGGRFALLRKIGEGSFGLVYEAEDRLDGGRVALKVLRQLGPEWADRFKREFRSLRDLEHPNIISLFELFFLDERWFFTMELLDGVSLLDHVRYGNERGALDEVVLRSTFTQLARALAALHATGKVHRDVKPSNIVVTREGRVVLLDLGLVTDAEGHELSQQNRIVGTPSYMAPEQAVAGDIGPPADMYAVGAMLYECLDGKLPFSTDAKRVLLEKLTTDPAPLRDGAPRDLALLASALLNRDPSARPTALDVIARLGVQAEDHLRPRESAPAVKSARVHLVGREAELEALEAELGRTVEGKAVLLGVSGPSGIGKTALISAFVDRLRDEERAIVFTSRCYEREAVPFKAFDDVVDSVVRHLQRLPEGECARILPPDLGALERMFPSFRFVHASRDRFEDLSDPRELRQRAFETLGSLFGQMRQGRPLVLWLDDVQWADVDSAKMLVSLLPPVGPSSLLVIVTHRPVEGRPGPFLETLGSLPDHDVHRAEIALGALGRDQARTLAETALGVGDRAGPFVELVTRDADGNPFFIKEFASFLRAKSLVESRPEGNGFELSIEQMILGRVRELSPGAMRLLEVISIAGTPIARSTAFAAARVGADTHASLTTLRSRKLVATRGEGESARLSGYHDRITEIVVAALTPAGREACHRDIAEALERSPDPDPEVLVYHYRGANDLPRAASYAVTAAGRAAKALAFDRAARLYGLALELGRFDDAERVALDIELAGALANAGHGKQAADVYLDTAARTDAKTAIELRRRAGEQLLRSGHVDEGFAIAESVLRDLGLRPPASRQAALVSLVARRAVLALRGYSFVPCDEGRVPARELGQLDAIWSATVTAGLIDPIRGAELQVRHVATALRLGEPYRVARALGFETAHLGSQGAAAPKAFDGVRARTSALVREVGRPHATALFELAEAMGASCMGRFRDAVAHADAAVRIFRAECPGAGWEIATARIFANVSLALLGEIRELRRRQAVHAKEGWDSNDRYSSWVALSGYSVLGHLAADRPDNLRAEIEDALLHWSRQVFTLQHHWASLALALVDLYTGNEARAVTRLAAEAQRHESAHMLRIESVRVNFRVAQVRCLIATADPRRPEDVKAIAQLVRSLEREKVSWARPIADMTSGALAWLRRRDGEAVSRLTSAVAGFESYGMELFAAAARWRLGEILGGDEGRALIARSEAAMREQAIVRPEALRRALVPAFDRAG